MEQASKSGMYGVPVPRSMPPPGLGAPLAMLGALAATGLLLGLNCFSPDGSMLGVVAAATLGGWTVGSGFSLAPRRRPRLWLTAAAMLACVVLGVVSTQLSGSIWQGLPSLAKLQAGFAAWVMHHPRSALEMHLIWSVVLSPVAAALALLALAIHALQPRTRVGSLAFASERLRAHRAIAALACAGAPLLLFFTRRSGYRPATFELCDALDPKSVLPVALALAAGAWLLVILGHDIAAQWTIARVVRALTGARPTVLPGAGELEAGRVADLGLGATARLAISDSGDPYRGVVEARYLLGDAEAARAFVRRRIAIDLAALAFGGLALSLFDLTASGTVAERLGLRALAPVSVVEGRLWQVHDLQLEGDSLYFVGASAAGDKRGQPPVHDSIMLVPKGGGSPVVLYQSPRRISKLRVQDGALYWLDSNGGLYRKRPNLSEELLLSFDTDDLPDFVVIGARLYLLPFSRDEREQSSRVRVPRRDGSRLLRGDSPGLASEELVAYELQSAARAQHHPACPAGQYVAGSLFVFRGAPNWVCRSHADEDAAFFTRLGPDKLPETFATLRGTVTSVVRFSEQAFDAYVMAPGRDYSMTWYRIGTDGRPTHLRETSSSFQVALNHYRDVYPAAPGVLHGRDFYYIVGDRILRATLPASRP